MTTPLDIARLQIGYRTPPDHRTPWGLWYASHGTDASFVVGPDCAMFVSWCHHRAGIVLPEMQAKGYPGFAKAQIGLDWCRAHKWMIDLAQLQPGDLIWFDWDGNGRTEHVGLVDSYPADGMIMTVEGNTGTPRGVRRRCRSLAMVLGAARLPSSLVPSPPPSSAPPAPA